MQVNGFQRRAYTWAHFRRAVADILAHRDELRAASSSQTVDHAFAEKIMLAVTQVNDCRYCRYGHTQAALAAGISADELARLLAGELGSFPEHEAVALTFAQHYAESQEQPDPAAWERLVATYGPEDARSILAWVRMITLGNLLGNTFDAFLSRLRGVPSPQTTLADEIAVLGAVIVPSVALPLAVLGGLAWLMRRVVRRA